MNKNILPKTSSPKRYEIKLDIDLENFTYVGMQTVEVEVLENTKLIYLNSLGIQVSHASLISNDQESINLSVEYFENDERISLSSKNEIENGTYKLYMEFKSEITNDLKGFYRSKFLTKEEEEKWIATTQFEPTSARNAFPCWDEPEYKAVFSITIVADKKYLRVSNEKVLSEKEVEDNKIETTFVDSMKMSTYLVAFVIGELEVTEIGEAGNTKVRIVHRPGFSDQTNYAGRAGIELLNFFEDYYKIPYPGSKLDLIAIPDFAMGAMENVGAVTFRENLLLIDEEKATRPELNRSVTVIAHELAHMWFGDLVTMKWWDGIWLNEAFASLMEVIAADNKYPEFKLWNEMNLSRSAGFAIDSLENSRPIEFDVETPEEAEEMFDVLTYEKGSTVLRMFEVFIGEEVFQKGVQEYLNKFKYDNTNSSDLWDSLSKASGQSLNEMLPYWIKEKGYPSVSVSVNDSCLYLEQKRFLLKNIKTENKNKPIPISIRFLDTEEKLNLILDETNKELDIGKKGNVPVVNSGGWGFYHVFYDEEAFNKILNNFDKLDQLEKYRLLEDRWMQFKKHSNELGESEIINFLKFLLFYKDEKDEDIWNYIGSIIATLSCIPDENIKKTFKEFVDKLTLSLSSELGIKVNPEEDPEIKELRGLINKIRAKYLEEREFINYFSEIFNDESFENISEGSFFNTVLYIAALDETNEVEKFLEKFIKAPSPQIQGRYRSVLGIIKDRNAPQEIVKYMIEGKIRGADCPYILASMIMNKYIGRESWLIIKENFNELLKVMPAWTASRILDALSSIYDEELGNDIKDFITKNPLPSSEKIAAQKLERLEANIEFILNIKNKFNEEAIEKVLKES